MRGDFKGTVFQKIEWGDICLLSMNSLKVNFLDIFKTKTALCVYNTQNGEINTKSVYISVNNKF
jgi:hypothetical protein